MNEEILKMILEKLKEVMPSETPKETTEKSQIVLTVDETIAIVDYLVEMSVNINSAKLAVNKLLEDLEKNNVELCHNLLKIIDGD